MKRILSVIIALAMLIGAAPLAVFAGGGTDFPPVPCINQGDPMRPDGSFTGVVPAGGSVYVDFYTGAECTYVFESVSSADLSCTVYDSNGDYIASDDDSGSNMNFKIYAKLGYKCDYYLEITNNEERDVEFTVKNSYSDVAYVEVVSWPTTKTYLPYMTYVRTEGLEFKITYTDGTTARWLPAIDYFSPDGIKLEANIIGEIQMGENDVYMTCYGFDFYFTINVIDYNFDGARITRMPYKSTYVVGEDYDVDTEGLAIQLTKNGVGVETVNFGGRYDGLPELVQFFDFTPPIQLGENVINIQFFNGVTVPVTVYGIESPVASIELLKAPDKTEYYAYGGGFMNTDVTGAKLRIRYTDGSSRDVVIEDPYEEIDGYRISSYFENYNLVLGENTLVIEYMGASCTATVTGVPLPVTEIGFYRLPDRLDYFLEEVSVSLKGAEFYIKYEDGSEKTFDIDDSYLIYDDMFIEAFLMEQPHVGQNLVTVYYYNKTASFYVNYSDNGIKRVTIAENPELLSYSQTSFVSPEDLTGLKLNILYENGTSEIWDYDANGGIYRGAPVFYGYYVEEEGPNALPLSVAGKPVTLYINGTGFFVMEWWVVSNPNSDGNWATVHFVLEDGDEFEVTFAAVYDEDGYAEGVYTRPGYGNFGYSIYRDAKQDGERGVQIWIFDRLIFAPYAGWSGKGDMDGDGEITVADALKALRIAAKLVNPTPEDIAIGDVDGDGDITVADALKILRVAAQLIPASELG